MIGLFLLLFKITPPVHHNTSKHIDYSQTIDCADQLNINHDFNNKKDTNNAYIYCYNEENKDQLLIENCTFKKINMRGSYFSIGNGYYSYFILVFQMNFTIIRSNFLTAYGWNSLLKFEKEENDNDYRFLMDSCLITDFTPDMSSGGPAECVIWSEAKTVEFINNTIDTCKCPAIYLSYYADVKLVSNIIINANHENKAAIDFGLGTPNENFELSDCMFINCTGKGKNTFYLNDVDSDFILKNITFDNCVNNNGNSKDYIVFIKTTQNDLCLTLDNCHFRNLESNTHNGGGIGLLFDQNGSDEKHQKVIYINTTFENIKNNSPGGAISFTYKEKDSDYDNGLTELIMQNCFFDTIESTSYGGAINYQSKKPIIIDNCTFINIKSSDNGGAIYIKNENTSTISHCTFYNINSANIGGSIYAEFKQSITIQDCIFNKSLSQKGHSIFIDNYGTQKAYISSCTFIDCGNDKASYSIELQVQYFDFENNIVTFLDQEKCCGCINLELGIEFLIKGNTFSNAQINNNLDFSAGINYDSTSSDCKLTIENNTFDNILGNNKGRCIDIVKYSNTQITIKNNTIKNCPLGGPLLHIYFNSKQDGFDIMTTDFIRNSVGNYYDTQYGCTPQVLIENPVDSSKGFSSFLTLAFYQCKFVQNSSPNGGALRFGASIYLSNTKLRFYNCDFIENTAEDGYDDLYVQSYHGIYCQTCSFTRNKSNNNGKGSIYIDNDFKVQPGDKDLTEQDKSLLVSLIKCTFKDETNSCANKIVIKNTPNTPIEVTQCIFDNCKTTNHIISMASLAKSIQISNCSFAFADEKSVSKAVYSVTNNIIFLGNTFQNCAINTIQIEGLDDNNRINFIENTFNGIYNGEILNIKFKMQPLIERNTFTNAELANPILIFELQNELDTLLFTNNTFSNLNMNSEWGGISLQVEIEKNNNPLHLTFENCSFINNTNQNNDHPGGVICCDSKQNSGNTYLCLFGCVFEDNYHNKLGGSIYINAKDDIMIERCTFTNNTAPIGSTIYINPDYTGYSDAYKIMITGCHFQKNNALNKASVYIQPGSTKIINVISCTFEEEYALYIDNVFNNIELNDNTFHNSVKESALQIIQKAEVLFDNEISIIGCIFDSCSGKENKCFYILIETFNKFTFNDCTIRNMKGTGVDDYFGTFDTHEGKDISLENVTFIDNICDSLYGGGIGLKFIELNSLEFKNCHFINNTAKQNKSKGRPSLDQKEYYNGDGGAIQLGYICHISDMNLLFYDCIFRNNRASRHGGALAIQTYYQLIIQKCIFENNIANYDSSANLLFDNYFDMKPDGRGGAIYINPAFSYDAPSEDCPPPRHPLTTISIQNCVFKSNNAYDGYALYIEGDDPETKWTITMNDFIDNYNESNSINENEIYGAVITSEICPLFDYPIDEKNTFNNSKNIKVSNFSCVDHSGHTQTQQFSNTLEFSQSQEFSLSPSFTPIPESSISSESSEIFESTTISNEIIDSESSEIFESATISNEIIDSETSNHETNSILVSDSSNEIIESDSTKYNLSDSNIYEKSESDSIKESENPTLNEVSESEVTNYESNSITNEYVSNSFEEPNDAISSTNEIVNSETTIYDSHNPSSISNSEDIISSSANEESDSTLPIDSSESIPTNDPYEPSGDTCIIEKKEMNITMGNRCYYSAEEGKNEVLAYIIRSEFIDFKSEKNGGAVFIENCGLNAFGNKFICCISMKGCGGAIYVKNSILLQKNLTFEYVIFKKCQALYGGGCYIYSSSSSNEFNFNNCTFDSNIATKTSPSNKDDPFFSGSALFISSRKGSIANSTFKNNKSKGSVKFYNVFNEESQNDLLTLEENKEINSIVISECEFVNKGKSESSIYHISDKEGSQINVINCIFRGKQEKRSNYIVEEILMKDAPKINIKSCDFQYETKISADINMIINNYLIIRNSSFIFLFLFIFSIIITILIMKSAILNQNKIDNETKMDYFEDNYNHSTEYNDHLDI